MNQTSTFSTLLQKFFADHLMQQFKVSPHTVTSYRDTFRLVFEFAQKRIGKSPSEITLADFNADFVLEFLSSLEIERKTKERSRNQRLAAIRSFYKYVAFQAPQAMEITSRVLAIRQKRHDKRLIDFLMPDEVQAILAIPDRTTWIGRRDHALLLFAVQTGLRVSELVSVKWKHLVFDRGAHVQCLGKGRKERTTPLSKQVVELLRIWGKEIGTESERTVFPNSRGEQLSSDSVQYLLAKYVAEAVKQCPSLASKRVSPHVLRHTTAMQLLKSGVDLSVIAIWLGHESIETSQIYAKADLTMKEDALKKAGTPDVTPGRFQPDDNLLRFLKAL